MALARIQHDVTFHPILMQAQPSPVTAALILVCEKCGKRIDSDADRNPSRRLLSRLKKTVKGELPKGTVRPVLTSCMNICPEGRISVAIAPVAGGSVQFFTVKADDAERQSERLIDALKQDQARITDSRRPG